MRANMVEHPAEYPWSSYRGNAMGKEIKLLTPHEIYSRLGVTEDARHEAYRALLRGRMTGKSHQRYPRVD